MAKQIPTILYHYCSLPSFQKIIESQSIWLSDICKSNDFLELKWLYDEFHIYFLSRRLKYAKKQLALYSHFVKKLTSNSDDIPELPIYESEHLDDVENTIMHFQASDSWRSYVFCFSEMADSLSQWRGYADDGCGIAIGFDKDYFTLLNGCELEEGEIITTFDKVIYGSMNAKRYFNKVTGFEQITTDSSSEEFRVIAERALLRISKRAAFFKNGSFSEENEWRIAVTLLNDRFDTNQSDIKLLNKFGQEDLEGRYYFKKLGYISAKDKLISHIDLLLPKFKEAVKVIYIGPKSKVSITDMQMFLIANGLLESMDDRSIEIHRSESSYR